MYEVDQIKNSNQYVVGSAGRICCMMIKLRLAMREVLGGTGGRTALEKLLKGADIQAAELLDSRLERGGSRVVHPYCWESGAAGCLNTEKGVLKHQAAGDIPYKNLQQSKNLY